jgi:hypothetical protein
MKYMLIIALTILAPAECFSQVTIGGEFESGEGYFRAAIGTRVVLSTWFYAFSSNERIEEPPVPIFKNDSSITAFVVNNSGNPPFEDSIVIYITSKTPRCFVPPGDGVVAYVDSQDVYPSNFGYPEFYLSGIFYDPKIVGKISGPDSLYCGSIKADTLAMTRISFCNDSLAQFREIVLLSVNPPFGLDDSIDMTYPCISYSDLGTCSFHPTAPGHYIDTAKLLDPLTNDTISVVLIGDAYDAGVSTVPEPKVKLFPNPCDRELQIDIPSDASQIKIYNLFGECVYTSKLQSSGGSIDCSDFPAGVYFVSIDGMTSPQKLIVAH